MEASKQSSSSTSTKSKSSAKNAPEATAPGPIDPAHESGTWEQTNARLDAEADARRAGSSELDRSESRILPPR
jgi:hypothetical protein